MRKLLPERINTEGWRPYAATSRMPRIERNRAENSCLPIRRRERKMQGFKSARSAQ